jgi:hypothetical protein
MNSDGKNKVASRFKSSFIILNSVYSAIKIKIAKFDKFNFANIV